MLFSTMCHPEQREGSRTGTLLETFARLPYGDLKVISLRSLRQTMLWTTSILLPKIKETKAFVLLKRIFTFAARYQLYYQHNI